MMVSTKGRYALRVMVELAARGLEEFVPLKEIAEHQEISEKYLEAIMKSLVKEGLVTGLRGKGGGYRLSKPPAQYTVCLLYTSPAVRAVLPERGAFPRSS